MFQLTIDTSNAAFYDDEGNYKPDVEINRILYAIAVQAADTCGPIRDVNGNTIGRWVLVPLEVPSIIEGGAA